MKIYIIESYASYSNSARVVMAESEKDALVIARDSVDFVEPSHEDYLSVRVWDNNAGIIFSCNEYTTGEIVT